MLLDYLIYALAAVCMVAGLAGCILPVLPGPPLSYVGMLLLYFSGRAEFSVAELVLAGLAVVVVQVLDYLSPMIGTKGFGGTKWGSRGCIAGTIIGLFFLPWGLIVGPFAGAVIGELAGGSSFPVALKSGFGSFVGFLLSTLLKLGVCIYFIVRLITVLI